MIYIADVEYESENEFAWVIIGTAPEQFPERNTYSPSEVTYHNFRGLEYRDGYWEKETSGTVSVVETATEHKDMKTARRFLFKMIFFEE
jgi:hypothetical protein